MTLELKHISFERQYETLFSDISCRLHAGESLQVYGENGSGKSTLLRILAGYLEPEMGTIFWNNQCIYQKRDDYQQQLQYIGHQNGIKLQLTIDENIKLMATLTESKINSQQIKNILQKFNLENLIHRKAQTLSAGQLRRVALTRLFLKPAQLWVLDEPTTSLDKQGQELFFNLLQQHLRQGGMAILTTHQPLTLSVNQSIQLGKKYD